VISQGGLVILHAVSTTCDAVLTNAI